MADKLDLKISQLSLFKELTVEEHTFALKLLDLFALVHAQQPDKGIKSLLTRARRHAQQHGSPLTESLQIIYDEAAVRTHRRMALLNQCALKEKNNKAF